MELTGKFPWATYATAQRAFFATAAIADAIEEGDWDLARGRVVQMMRWLLLHLEIGQKNAAL